MQMRQIPRWLKSSALGIALALLATMLAPAVRAQEPTASLPDGGAEMLAIAQVSAPDIYCIFNTTAPCSLPATAEIESDIALTGTNGQGSLHSSLGQQGVAGTAGASLYPYLYRIDFSDLLVTGPPIACVNALRIPFGRITPVDYDADGAPEDLFVVTSGGSGGVGLSVAFKDAEFLYLTFDGSICPQTAPGTLGSFVIGVASTTPSDSAVVRLTTSFATFHFPNAITTMAHEIMLPMVTR